MELTGYESGCIFSAVLCGSEDVGLERGHRLTGASVNVPQAGRRL